MKKIITVCFIVFSAYYVQAQTTASADTGKKMYWWQIAVGGGIDNGNNMKKELNTPSIDSKGASVRYDNFSKVVGARIGGARNVVEGLMIGGNLTYDMFLTQSITGLADLSAVRYGGNLTFGPTFYYKNFLINPYGGVGYAYEMLTVENKSTAKTVNFDLNTPIAVGEKKKYTTDYFMLEVGVGVKKALTKSFAVGLDGGAYFSPTFGGAWKDGSVAITSRKAPGSNGGFIRLTFAYGRFK